MKNILIITALLASATFLQGAGCSKKCPCDTGGINMNFVGFTNQETDTIIMRSFVRGSNFSNLSDTFKITAANSGFYLSNDTLHISIRLRSPGIESTNDYEFQLNQNNLKYRLSDFAETREEELCYQRNLNGCRNIITSVKVNGQPINTFKPISSALASELYIRR
jgi:hypothetical protein